MNFKKALFFIFNRATYGRTKSILRELVKKCDVYCLVSPNKGENLGYIKEIENLKIHQVQIEGVGKSGAAARISEIIKVSSDAISEIQPDISFVIADRYETIGAAIASNIHGVPVCHIQGGEITLNIDEKIRHAVTKLSDYHFTSTAFGRRFVIMMGEDWKRVFWVGCPSLDLIRENGIFRKFTSDKNVISIFHPHTKDRDLTSQVMNYMEALKESMEMERAHAYIYYPNLDPGEEEIREVLDYYTNKYPIIFIKEYNSTPEVFYYKLASARFIIGNSSAILREASFIGVPGINVGTRQGIRERASNVMDTPPIKADILGAIHRAWQIKRHPRSYAYGDGRSATRIMKKLERILPEEKGALTYPKDNQFYFSKGRLDGYGKRRFSEKGSIKEQRFFQGKSGVLG